MSNRRNESGQATNGYFSRRERKGVIAATLFSAAVFGGLVANALDHDAGQAERVGREASDPSGQIDPNAPYAGLSGVEMGTGEGDDSNTSNTIVVEAKPGDTVWGIVREQYGPEDEIRGVVDDVVADHGATLQPGDEIKVPVPPEE